MIGAGIADADILVIDRALEASHRSIVLAQLETGFVVKRYLVQGDQIMLEASHPDYPPIEIEPDTPYLVWGVVLFVIRAVHPHSISRLAPCSSLSKRESDEQP